jgi:hypothetical protein
MENLKEFELLLNKIYASKILDLDYHIFKKFLSIYDFKITDMGHIHLSHDEKVDTIKKTIKKLKRYMIKSHWQECADLFKKMLKRKLIVLSYQ